MMSINSLQWTSTRALKVVIEPCAFCPARGSPLSGSVRCHLNIRDYLNIGLKLLGVYFAVLGVTVAAVTLLNFAIQTIQAALQRDDVLYYSEGPVISLISAAQPIAYLICAFVLTRKTEWCLKLIGYPPEGT